jgi:hypothetical protein
MHPGKTFAMLLALFPPHLNLPEHLHPFRDLKAKLLKELDTGHVRLGDAA